ncbi:MAG: hypothetical protein V2I65_11345, partial [Paracoccaceae bacterium]|nr:hypothetical protein [Paracoccaceae bacterium]
MSRNVIVGLAILVVAALSWIVIDRMSEGDVAVQGDGSAVEIEQEALVVEEDEIPPTVATPE